MQLTQSEVGRDIVGDGNVVNAVNTVNNLSEKRETKGWWTGPVGIAVLGVLANVAKWVCKSSCASR